ncbi:cytochrome P450 [Lophiotrema nucula]|uniref:Cytochrome P450 n=1 Tax=Lophiotrema nucula TaxID=690887 RepID=A0A6A5ZAN4_9PLEO|nr:cytochrome P450 [Lophiotrema nucula]
MSNVIAVLVTGAIVIYGGLQFLLHHTQDAKEPPPAYTAIPYLGAMIGLSRKKAKFYVELRDKHDLPIYTIRLPGSRLYIVNSPSLIPAVQREFKALAFPPIAANGAKTVCGSSKTANDILDTNVNGEEGDWGYSMTFYKRIHAALAPGPALDAMNRVMAEKISGSMDRLEGEKTVQLLEFVKHEIAMASTDSVYGRKNPFKDPAIEERFWKFQPGILILLMNIFPSLLAKDSLEAREFMTRAFVRYFEQSGHLDGSELINTRFKHSTEHKVPVEDIARFEVGNTIGILTNTVPGSFWVVYHLFSNPVALAECREELSKVISDVPTTVDNGETTTLRTIDMSQVKVSCPILLSTLQEVLRVHTVGISTRMVMQDHVLDGKYLLKKGGTVMIPTPVHHTNTSTWGTDVHEFNHRRFLPKERRHNPVSFRGFGGGTTLCPGRHFASTEILTFAAMLILRFDVTPVGGNWVNLTTNKADMWEATPMPDSDIEVKITPRDQKGKFSKWRILVTDSDKAMPLAAEDTQ